MNILYGVPGEGMGHATRSKVIIGHLLQNHRVKIVSSSRAFQFLQRSFPGQAEEIKGFHFAYKNAEVSKAGTFALNLKNAPGSLLHNTKKYLQILKTFKPDLVISDFESFSYLYAKQHDIPVISIDNMQVIDRCTLEITIPDQEKKNYLLAKTIVKAKLPRCDHYFISSFFDASARKKNTTLVPPIVREVITGARPYPGNHILVYQTSCTSSLIKKVLLRVPDINFYVYGFNKNEQEKNVIFKTFSEEGFVNDLASAKAVISNGGFSFISEAVYLKKPIYSFPIKNQFEQFVNAAYIDKLGYGKHFNEFTIDNLKSFLYDLDIFSNHLSGYSQIANEILFQKLEKRVNSL